MAAKEREVVVRLQNLNLEHAREILWRFSQARSLLETAARALEAKEEELGARIGDELATLRQAVDAIGVVRRLALRIHG